MGEKSISESVSTEVSLKCSCEVEACIVMNPCYLNTEQNHQSFIGCSSKGRPCSHRKASLERDRVEV